MPLYEFHCQQCDYTFEKLFSKPEILEPAVCPHCQGTDCEKLFSTFSSVSKTSPAEEVPSPCTFCGNAKRCG